MEQRLQILFTGFHINCNENPGIYIHFSDFITKLSLTLYYFSNFMVQHDCSFASSLSSHPIPYSLLLHFQSEKCQVSHRYRQSMAYQVTVGISTSPCIRAQQGNSIGEITQKPAKVLGIAPAATVSPTSIPSYT